MLHRRGRCEWQPVIAFGWWLRLSFFKSCTQKCCPHSIALHPQHLLQTACVFFFFPISWFERRTTFSDAMKISWLLHANSLLFQIKLHVRHIKRAGPCGVFPSMPTHNPLNTNFEFWMCFVAGWTWTLNLFMLNLQNVWAADVGARSTADKCDAVWSSLTWAAVLRFRTLQLSKRCAPLICHYQFLPCTMAVNWFVQQSISENHHYCKKGNSYRKRLELKLEPDRE